MVAFSGRPQGTRVQSMEICRLFNERRCKFKNCKYRYVRHLYHLAIECPLTPKQSGQPSSSGPPAPNVYRQAAAASASRLASQARPNQPQRGLLSVSRTGKRVILKAIHSGVGWVRLARLLPGFPESTWREPLAELHRVKLG